MAVAGNPPYAALPFMHEAATHRDRLVAGMVAAVAQRGYAATTITDVVANARVSRRTFYEHFVDKEACFLAAYEAVSDAMLAAIADAIGQAGRWEDERSGDEGEARGRILSGIHAYLRALADEPAIARVFIVEILTAGPAALARRRAVLRRFTAQVREQVEAARAAGVPVRPLGEPAALALVGAIHESVLATLEEHPGDDARRALLALEDDLGAVVTAVLLPSS